MVSAYRSPTCQVIEGLSHNEDSQRHVGEGERATSVGCSNSSLDTGKYRCKQQKKTENRSAKTH